MASSLAEACPQHATVAKVVEPLVALEYPLVDFALVEIQVIVGLAYVAIQRLVEYVVSGESSAQAVIDSASERSLAWVATVPASGVALELVVSVVPGFASVVPEPAFEVPEPVVYVGHVVTELAGVLGLALTDLLVALAVIVIAFELYEQVGIANASVVKLATALESAVAEETVLAWTEFAFVAPDSVWVETGLA